MIFDTEAQKERVLGLIGKVPISTTIAGLASGLSPEMAALLKALHLAPVVPVDRQAELLTLDEGADDGVVACGLCGKPMPIGEETFRYHGHSGPCPDDEEAGG